MMLSGDGILWNSNISVIKGVFPGIIHIFCSDLKEKSDVLPRAHTISILFFSNVSFSCSENRVTKSWAFLEMINNFLFLTLWNISRKCGWKWKFLSSPMSFSFLSLPLHHFCLVKKRQSFAVIVSSKSENVISDSWERMFFIAINFSSEDIFLLPMISSIWICIFLWTSEEENTNENKDHSTYFIHIHSLSEKIISTDAYYDKSYGIKHICETHFRLWEGYNPTHKTYTIECHTYYEALVE